MERYDAIIIGFGKGGKTLAGKLAGMGSKVALVEKSDKMYGGTCINVGCIPSKSLVRSAEVSYGHPGMDFKQKSALYKKAIQEKRRVTSMLRGKNYDKLNILPNVAVIHGTASFHSNTVLDIETDNGKLQLEGEKIYINTGSTPVIPRIPGLEDNPFVYISETLMELEVLPERLVIIGGGYIGLEFASMYSGFGSKVTVLQDGEQLIPREDRDIAFAVQEILENRGVEFKLGAAVHRVVSGTDKASVEITYGGETLSLEAEAVLVATGRRPNTDGLNAAAAGVELTHRGAVVVDDYLRTTAPNIWAMGDVAGGLQFTYVSLDDSRIIWSQIHGQGYSLSGRKNVPYSVFLATPYSRVGLNEEEAVEHGYSIRVLKLPVQAIPKAQVLKKTEGLLKAVIDQDTGKILGAMLLCEESYEMINIVKLAMDMDADYRALANQIFTHPTMSEALNDLFAV